MTGEQVEALMRDRIVNPFFVLGVEPAAVAAEIERQGQRLLSELAAGLQDALRFATPFGARARTPELVRWAVSELRDPARRFVHEWWARGLTAAP
jgi:hypothetical protein